MTPTVAKYIGDNFTVVTHIETGDTLGSGFDATVWRDKAGTLIVSMQGSSGLQDFLSDLDLAMTGNARAQLVTMINWWLRETAPAGVSVRQIVEVINPIPGTASFEEGTAAIGTGRVTASALMAGVEVNGHSLGGYLASAFTRLFGSEAHVTHTSTFNGAGFAPGSERVFAQLQSLIGPSYGLGRFPNGAEQSNYFAKNGLNVTTNSFWFSQVGTRVELFNEADATQVGNHFMYKLTDALALGNALSKLDPTLTVAKMNTLLALGSNNTHASIEGAFDALRRALAGPNVQPLQVSDASDSDAFRATYHETLVAIQTNPIFMDLAGKLKIELADRSLADLARNDFGALISLRDLSPLYISGNSAAAKDQLAELWQAGRTDDYAAWLADKSAATPETFSDKWIGDRANLLHALLVRNKQDNTNGLVYDVSAPSDRALAFQWFGADPLPGEVRPRQATLFFQRQGGSKEQRIVFGDETANAIDGTNNPLGDHLYGEAGGDTLNGLSGDDYLEGGAGIDNLNGGEGADKLYGGLGNDILDGGAGMDFLHGGAGVDAYRLKGTELGDVIDDSDGLGTITVDGKQLKGGNKIADGYWQSEDKSWDYMLTTGGDLIIVRHGGSGADTITVKGWKDKPLGIGLSGKTALSASAAAAPAEPGELGITLSDELVERAATPVVYTDVGKPHRDGNGNIMGWGKEDRRPRLFVEGGLYDVVDPLVEGSAVGSLLCGRTRRASVPHRLRARGSGACGARLRWRQRPRWRASSVASANWLRRTGTATRHVCGFGGVGEQNCQGHNIHSMRPVAQKWPGRCMGSACSVEQGVAA